MFLKDISISTINFKINLDTKRPHQKIIYEKGDWEPVVTKAFLQHLTPGMTVIDVGACIGWYTLMASSIVGNDGRVISFEPDPYYLNTLNENVGLNGFTNVKCYKDAVSDVDGEGFMVIQELPTWTEERVARLLGCGETHQQRIPVNTTTLDSFLSTENIQGVDFMKIDVEGAEEKVLRGMKQTVKNNPGIKIVCEIHNKKLPIYDASKESLLTYIIEDLGLSRSRIGGTYWLIYD